ncbi:cryptochrome/photolyase family protein [Nocardioides piscis]|uniref:Deoxyribodipyrimidine photo-lyase n=1 Tax=Nocardioides piscis TaxID=2714938 RepID=A0A6G7YFD4_9ACTN|nr:deoxyribodipyrimidine photo-lyase [Nocardioides piscis]QIK75503.1 deoxyribodipyrimidine photo-lyase [Nocardioides piscis]
MSSVMWFRRDLRLRDNPALQAALAHGPTTALFVVDPALWSSAGPGRRAWLAANVLDLAERIPLTIRYGDAAAVVSQVTEDAGAGAVHISAETTPFGRRRDAAVGERVDLVATGSPYAVGPGLVTNGSGGPYQVFSAFARAWRDHGWAAPAAAPDSPDLAPADSDPEAVRMLTDAVARAPFELPHAGEDAARSRWHAFRDDGLADYAVERDRPDHDGTSRLSPYLHLGLLHPRTLLAELDPASTFATELAWRDFYADVLWHNPGSAWSDLKPALSAMTYDDPDDAIEAWRTGTTGFPIVDAGMRQLRETGWMHNRVRMITASFLTKDLHVWWPVGARHFLSLLLDGDIASNNHGWQWVAGTGTDASPYFRVFNPITQGKKFDPEGDYVRRWVPELRHLEGPVAHEPWRSEVGHDAGYPLRIVDHAAERVEALDRYRSARG